MIGKRRLRHRVQSSTQHLQLRPGHIPKALTWSLVLSNSRVSTYHACINGTVFLHYGFSIALLILLASAGLLLIWLTGIINIILCCNHVLQCCCLHSPCLSDCKSAAICPFCSRLLLVNWLSHPMAPALPRLTLHYWSLRQGVGRQEKHDSIKEQPANSRDHDHRSKPIGLLLLSVLSTGCQRRPNTSIKCQ